MDCRHLEFSSTLGSERRQKAEAVLGKRVVTKIIAIALYWLGTKRAAIASVLGIPENSLRTTVRVVLRDGLPALEDRRHSHRPVSFLPPPSTQAPTAEIKVEAGDDGISVSCGEGLSVVKLPSANPLQSRVVLLTMVNSGVLPARLAGEILDLSAVRVRTLAERLAREDVQGVFDKRQGGRSESVLTPEVQAQVMLQCSANAVTGRSTASKAVAADIGARKGIVLNERTLRHCVAKLGLRQLIRELPKLIADIKRGASP